MNIFGKIHAVIPRDHFELPDHRTIYPVDIVISVPECRLSQMGSIYLKGKLVLCTLMSESPNPSTPSEGSFVCADINSYASYSQEKATYFNRTTLNKWVDLNSMNWQWQ